MFGLDVTHKALATPARRAAIESIETPVAQAVGQMLAYYDRTDVDRYGDVGTPLHDPCVIAYLLRRIVPGTQMFRYRRHVGWAVAWSYGCRLVGQDRCFC